MVALGMKSIVALAVILVACAPPEVRPPETTTETARPVQPFVQELWERAFGQTDRAPWVNWVPPDDRCDDVRAIWEPRPERPSGGECIFGIHNPKEDTIRASIECPICIDHEAVHSVLVRRKRYDEYAHFGPEWSEAAGSGSLLRKAMEVMDTMYYLEGKRP